MATASTLTTAAATQSARYRARVARRSGTTQRLATAAANATKPEKATGAER